MQHLRYIPPILGRIHLTVVQTWAVPADCWEKIMTDPLCGEQVPVCWEEHLTKEELLDLLKICHRKFYFRPRFIARALSKLESKQEFKRLTSSAVSLLKMELLKPSSHEAPV